MGKERLGAVVVIGSAQWPGANQESGGNNQGSSVGNIQLCCFGSTEDLNSRIKMIKVRSRGFRNKERFANAIYSHLGGLNLYPEGVVG